MTCYGSRAEVRPTSAEEVRALYEKYLPEHLLADPRTGRNADEQKAFDRVAMRPESCFRSKLSNIKKTATAKKTKPRFYWTEQQIEELREFAANGGTKKDARAKFGCTERNLRTVIKRYGIQFDTYKAECWTSAELQKLRNLYDDGTPAKDIATAIGRSASAIRKMASQQGIKRPDWWNYRRAQNAHAAMMAKRNEP